jgi:hypothetical protein
VDRSSLAISATYHVNAAITVRTGALEVTTRIVASNNSGDGIDRLELNTIAARFGRMKVVTATVDDQPVKVKVQDQTLLVPLGGILRRASRPRSDRLPGQPPRGLLDRTGCSRAPAARSRCIAGSRGSAGEPFADRTAASRS